MKAKHNRRDEKLVVSEALSQSSFAKHAFNGVCCSRLLLLHSPLLCEFKKSGNDSDFRERRHTQTVKTVEERKEKPIVKHGENA